MVYLALLMLMCRSSSGWRNTSSVVLLNSGSSSQKSTPLWASDISPGCGEVPPPTRATCEMVWWGALNGRWAMRDTFLLSLPAMECICVVSRLSERVSGGRMDGNLFAIMDLPDPGGHTMMRLCPPAAATSRARFTFSWPLTSA